MARVLFSLLGRPQIVSGANTTEHRYRRAKYDFDDGTVDERAVFVVALLEHLRRAKRLPDVAVILGTTKSIWAALSELLDDPPTDLWTRLFQHEESGAALADVLRPDLDALQALLSASLGVSVRCELVETLADERHQRALLDRMRALVASHDIVLADVTHGLGHQRILLAQTLVALETLTGVTIEALYSGALDLTDPATGRTPVVRLDGVLRSVRIDRAVAYARRAGDPRGFVDAIECDHRLRGPLERLADAWQLNQPEAIQKAARETVGMLGNLAPAAQAELASLRAHLDELIATHHGSIAAQQFAAARAALRRGDLLRSSLSLREACVSVGCVALGKAPDHKETRELAARDWVDAQGVEYEAEGGRDNAWRTVLTLRNAIAHATPPSTRAARAAFSRGPEAVMQLMERLVDSLEADLRGACPKAFQA